MTDKIKNNTIRGGNLKGELRTGDAGVVEDSSRMSGNVPNRWEEDTISSILQIIDYRGRTPPFSESGIPHIRSSNVKNGKIIWSDLKFVSDDTYNEYMTRGIPQKNDILFTTEGPLGDVALAPDIKFSLAQRLMILRPKEGILNPKLLLYQIMSPQFQRKISGKETGTTVKGVSSRNFQPIKILIPPFNEQNRIVAKIEELFTQLDAGIASLQAAQLKLNQYRKAVLKHAFEGKLTEAWRESHKDEIEPASVLLDKIQEERERAIRDSRKKIKKIKIITEEELATLSELPRGWRWVRLGNVTYAIGDVDHKMPKDCPNGIPYVATQNLTDKFKIDFSTSKTISRDDYIALSSKIKPEKGDIIFPRYGTIGKSILVDFDKEFLVSYSCAIIKNIPNVMNSKYVYHYLFSPIIKNEIRKYIRETTQANVGISSIEMFLFPICSLPEQNAIVTEIETRLSICDKLQTDISENLKKAETLRQSILKKAFEGRLVPQYPNDEPASVLLEKIRQEKITREPKKRGRKNKGT